METNKNKRIRLSQNQKDIFEEVLRYALGVVITGSVLATILIAPNALLLFDKLLKKKKVSYTDKDVRRSFNKLIKDRFIELYSEDGKDYLRITNKGRKQLIEFDIDTISIKGQKWDGKWRIVIFDIPEDFRVGRDVLRNKLREIGFVKIQKSVWACPYECQDEISFIASTFEVERYVNYIVADYVDNGEQMKKVFNLK